jgi:hypothetical protein
MYSDGADRHLVIACTWQSLDGKASPDEYIHTHIHHNTKIFTFDT